MSAGGIGLAKIDLKDGNVFFFVGRLINDLTQGVGGKRTAPEVDIPLFSDPVDGDNRNPIRNSMGALNRLPGVVLIPADLRVLSFRPTNGCRVEEYFRAYQCGKPRRLPDTTGPNRSGPQ